MHRMYGWIYVCQADDRRTEVRSKNKVKIKKDCEYLGTGSENYKSLVALLNPQGLPSHRMKKRKRKTGTGTEEETETEIETETETETETDRENVCVNERVRETENPNRFQS